MTVKVTPQHVMAENRPSIRSTPLQLSQPSFTKQPLNLLCYTTSLPYSYISLASGYTNSIKSKLALIDTALSSGLLQDEWR